MFEDCLSCVSNVCTYRQLAKNCAAAYKEGSKPGRQRTKQTRKTVEKDNEKQSTTKKNVKRSKTKANIPRPLSPDDQACKYSSEFVFF